MLNIKRKSYNEEHCPLRKTQSLDIIRQGAEITLVGDCDFFYTL